LKLSIVIPTYNAHEWIRAVPRFDPRAPARRRLRGLAVDDTSSDDTVAIVRSQFPEVRVFTNEKNLGFGKTVNVGLKASTGEYILVLNNDTWIHEGALDALMGYLDAHADTGIVGPKVLSGDGRSTTVPRRIHSDGRRCLTHGTRNSSRRIRASRATCRR